jgi:hypothetical protein
MTTRRSREKGEQHLRTLGLVKPLFAPSVADGVGSLWMRLVFAREPTWWLPSPV